MSNNITGVSPHASIEVSDGVYPWMNTPLAEVPTVKVELDEVAFLYGSIVGLNKSIRKIADSVSIEDSSSLQTVLFSGLPSLLSGNPHQGIGKVEGTEFVGGTLFTASRNIIREPSLIFAVGDTDNRSGIPVVLRAGVSNAKSLPKLFAVMGIKQVGGRRRKS
jgi:hypothetical protein